MPLFAEGKFAFVTQHLEEALHKEARGWIGLHDLYAILVDTATLQRDEAALWDYAPLLEKEAAHLDHNLYLAVAHRAWGVLHRLAGELSEAEVRFNQALAIFQAMDTRWQLGRTRFELGELAVARSDTAEASEQYARALELFKVMGAAPDVWKARKALESIGG